MKRSGSVTVFLALVITCCSALICALTESARTAGTRFYVRNMADSAIDSLFSRYHKPLWESYRLLGYEYPDDSVCIQDLENFMKPYVEDCGWYAISSPNAEITQKTFLTDDGGVWFEQEILDYLKYGWINLDFTPTSAKDLWEQIREAQTMDSIIKDYGLRTREAVAMEKSIMKIQRNLDAQKKLQAEARQQVRAGNNSSFQKTASQLERTIQSFPALIDAYDQKANAYSANLAEIEARHQADIENLRPENQEIIKKELASCREYADQDGIRRLEIDALDDNQDYTLRIIQDVRQFADETEDYIESADDEDDEDEDGDDIDEDALWASVANAWDSVLVPTLGAAHGIRDEETESLLESILDLAASGYLHIILPPDRSIPENRFDCSNFPSATSVTPRPDDSIDLLTSIAVNEYAGEYLPCFTDRAEQEITCQLEYVVAGKAHDKENLRIATSEILALREALNFIYIMANQDMRDEAHAIAEIIASAAHIPGLTLLVECLIIAAWALTEAFMDLRLLLEGKKAALIKTNESWMTDFTDILRLAGTLHLPEEKLCEADTGISYESYLKLLLFTKTQTERDYRTMDMIQANLIHKDPDFLIKNCLYGMHAQISCDSRHLFTLLGISASGGIDTSFPVAVETVKAY